MKTERPFLLDTRIEHTNRTQHNSLAIAVSIDRTFSRHSYWREKLLIFANVCLPVSSSTARPPTSRPYSDWTRTLVIHRTFIAAAILALAGCAQLAPTPTARTDAPAAPHDVFGFKIPPDALGARDPQLASVLAKTGALAAAQDRPTTIRVTALVQDFPYLNQMIRRGVPVKEAGKVSLENLAAGPNQSWDVSVRPTQQTPALAEQ